MRASFHSEDSIHVLALGFGNTSRRIYNPLTPLPRFFGSAALTLSPARWDAALSGPQQQMRRSTAWGRVEQAASWEGVRRRRRHPPAACAAGGLRVVHTVRQPARESAGSLRAMRMRMLRPSSREAASRKTGRRRRRASSASANSNVSSSPGPLLGRARLSRRSGRESEASPPQLHLRDGGGLGQSLGQRRKGSLSRVTF